MNESTPTIAKLDSVVQWIHEYHPGAERLTIVCHSMGGALVNSYLRNLQEVGRSQDVFRVIYLGSPLQGSLDAMSLPFKANPLFRRGGKYAALKFGGLGRNFVSVWNMFPSPMFDTKAPEARSAWYGPEPYHLVEDGVEYQSSYPWPIGDPNTTTEELLDGETPRLDRNPYAIGYCRNYRNRYLNADPAVALGDVDVWLVAGTGTPTLRGIVEYTRQAHDEYGIRIPDGRRTFDLYFDQGDGRVLAWSATNVNTDTTKTHTRYFDNVDHGELISSPVVGKFVADVIAGRPEPDYNYNGMRRDEPELNYRIDLRWRTDKATWVYKTNEGEAADKADIPVPPIALEIYDTDNDSLLVGLGAYTGLDDQGIEFTEVLETVYDDRFIVYCFGDDILVAASLPGRHNLRVVIRPSPELFVNTGGVETKSGLVNQYTPVSVVGMLDIRANGIEYVLPGEGFVDPDTGLPRSRIVFENTGGYGFQAYIDLELVGGSLLNANDLWLEVDADGDGMRDYQVSGVEGEEADNGVIAGRNALAIVPNPFNPSCRLTWNTQQANGGTVSIYNVRGELVRELATGISAAGTVDYDGRDGSGRQLAAGLYMVVLRSRNGDEIATAKISLIK